MFFFFFRTLLIIQDERGLRGLHNVITSWLFQRAYVRTLIFQSKINARILSDVIGMPWFSMTSRRRRSRF